MTYEWLKNNFMNNDEEPPDLNSLKNYMDNLKEFLLHSKQAKRFYWTILNALMGLIVSYIAYMAGLEARWAMTLLPIVTGLSQMMTKELNNRIK